MFFVQHGRDHCIICKIFLLEGQTFLHQINFKFQYVAIERLLYSQKHLDTNALNWLKIKFMIIKYTF